jgi:hypothetical protein
MSPELKETLSKELKENDGNSDWTAENLNQKM